MTPYAQPSDIKSLVATDHAMANTLSMPEDAPAKAHSANKPAFQPQQLLDGHRIHIEHGSQFFPDLSLMVHPKELDASNQQRFAAKLLKHHLIFYPSFLDHPARQPVLQTLQTILYPSLAAEVDDVKSRSEKLHNYAKTGQHPDITEATGRYQNPLAARIELRDKAPDIAPSDRDVLNQSVMLYLVLSEGLNERHYDKELAAHIHNPTNADGVLGEIAQKFDLRISELQQLASQGGVEAVAKAIGVNAATVQEIKELCELTSHHLYPENAIINWQVGRHLKGMEDRPIQEQMMQGARARAEAMRERLTATIAPDRPLPEQVSRDEKQVAALIRELPVPLQEALYYSGTEIGFTHGAGLRRDVSLHPALGYYLKKPFDYGRNDGLHQIMISSVDDVGNRRRFFHHEVNHLFFPKQLSEAETTQYETALREGSARYDAMRKMLDAYNAAESEQEKQAIAQQIDSTFRVGDIGLNEALKRGSDNAVSMESLHQWVNHAQNELSPDSPRLANGYPHPGLRAAEAMSRYAEMEFVHLKDNPDLLTFIAPHMKAAYQQLYLPHIERQNSAFIEEQQQLPEHLRYMGLPATGTLDYQPAEKAPSPASHAPAPPFPDKPSIPPAFPQPPLQIASGKAQLLSTIHTQPLDPKR